MRYSIEQKTGKYFKGDGLLSFARKHKKQLLNTELEQKFVSSNFYKFIGINISRQKKNTNIS